MNVAAKVTGDLPYSRIGFLGPFGTFTEQALRTQSDLAGAHTELMPFRSVPDVLDAVTSGQVEAGFVPIENSIEGMINFTLDALAFDHELLIQRDVVLDIEHCLMARTGTSLAEVHTVYSIPVATAQCHRFLREHLGAAEVWAANSTAEAARIVAEDPGAAPGSAAIAPRAAAERYGLEILRAGIEDQVGNQTRFVLVTRKGVPAPTGHDRTALVIYQRADEPGSLISILQEFAARRINLSNLISRPTKEGGLGEYCFIVFAEGHIDDDLLADALRALHTKQGGVKFFGSYPTADAAGVSVREHADARWREADDWVAHLRAQISAPSRMTSSDSSTELSTGEMQ
jgi:prephenate dehydratase